MASFTPASTCSRRNTRTRPAGNEWTGGRGRGGRGRRGTTGTRSLPGAAAPREVITSPASAPSQQHQRARGNQGQGRRFRHREGEGDEGVGPLNIPVSGGPRRRRDGAA